MTGDGGTADQAGERADYLNLYECRECGWTRWVDVEAAIQLENTGERRPSWLNGRCPRCSKSGIIERLDRQLPLG